MEFNLNCFKCDSTENLSVKYYTKVTRVPRLICNDCRKLYIKNPRNSKPEFSKENWNELAKEINGRLIKKYA